MNVLGLIHASNEIEIRRNTNKMAQLSWQNNTLSFAGVFQCRGVLLIWIIVGQGPIGLAVCAEGFFFGHFFSRLSFLVPFSLSVSRPDTD